MTNIKIKSNLRENKRINSKIIFFCKINFFNKLQVIKIKNRIFNWKKIKPKKIIIYNKSKQ
jgi:hypothetical protein